jgi:hypothetical protein
MPGPELAKAWKMRESGQFMAHLLSAEIFLLDFDGLDVGSAWYVAINLGGSDSIREHVIGGALPGGPSRRTRQVNAMSRSD